jgi:hypothetical protein
MQKMTRLSSTLNACNVVLSCLSFSAKSSHHISWPLLHTRYDALRRRLFWNRDSTVFVQVGIRCCATGLQSERRRQTVIWVGSCDLQVSFSVVTRIMLQEMTANFYSWLMLVCGLVGRRSSGFVSLGQIFALTGSLSWPRRQPMPAFALFLGGLGGNGRGYCGRSGCGSRGG